MHPLKSLGESFCTSSLFLVGCRQSLVSPGFSCIAPPSALTTTWPSPCVPVAIFFKGTGHTGFSSSMTSSEVNICSGLIFKSGEILRSWRLGLEPIFFWRVPFNPQHWYIEYDTNHTLGWAVSWAVFTNGNAETDRESSWEERERSNVQCSARHRPCSSGAITGLRLVPDYQPWICYHFFFFAPNTCF